MTILLPPFQFECHLFLFCLLVPAKTPVLCWIKEVRVRIIVFFWSKRKIFSLAPLSVMLAVGLSYMTFIMLKDLYSFYTQFVESFFYHEKMLYLVKCFFSIYWDNKWFLSFMLLVWYFTFIDCVCWVILVSHEYIPFGYGVWFSLLIFYWEFLHLYSSELVVHSCLLCPYLALVSWWCWPHKMTVLSF